MNRRTASSTSWSWEDPGRLAQRLPTLRLLTRPLEDIQGIAHRLRDPVAEYFSGIVSVEAILCESQIGSGALPTRKLPSAGLALRPVRAKRGSGTVLDRIGRAFRELPIPVIGRVQDGAFILDLRCLEDESVFGDQLAGLNLSGLRAK